MMGEMISSWGDWCRLMRDGGRLVFFPVQRMGKGNGVTDVEPLPLGFSSILWLSCV